MSDPFLRISAAKLHSARKITNQVIGLMQCQGKKYRSRISIKLGKGNKCEQLYTPEFLDELLHRLGASIEKYNN